ncbi:taste receptor type 2 member 8-like [Heteronotia binoei]|uniref:taste receptor type 2 member 8-like n=1 Tax=Heteronotia binoei TaxID=13085 RepID=UPI00292F030A|nr:taste receptor type 2 member 8-like [Heteronotia binoei]
MASAFFTILFTLLVMEVLVGMIANGFILLINCIDWFRSRKLSPVDLILSCLGLSRLAWQAIGLLDATLFFFFLGTYLSSSMQLMFPILFMFMNTVNIWFATWLSVLYFVKITIFSHPVILRVKQRFSRLVPWLLLGSFVFSAVFTTIIITGLNYDARSCHRYKSLLSNSNDSQIKTPPFCWYFTILATAPHFIAILIFASSTILLIVSLWKHTRSVQCNGVGPRDLSTQVHLTAIKALASFLILYLSCFIAIILQSLITWRKNHTWTSVLYHNVTAAYPSGHAIILILINPRLKQAWVRMLQHLNCLRDLGWFHTVKLTRLYRIQKKSTKVCTISGQSESCC